MVIVLLDIVRTILVDQVALRLHRLFRIEVRRQRLVLDLDQLQRLLRDFFGHGSHAGDVVADVTHLADRQRSLVVTDRKNSILIRSIFARNDRNHAIQGSRATGVDALDQRMWIRRMQNLANQHSGQAEVVGVLAAASGLAGGIHHGD